MIRVRKYKKTDLFQAAYLINNTFRIFNFQDNPTKASEDYVAYYDPTISLDDIRKRFEDASLFYVAESNAKVVGLLRAVNNRIVNLFVHEDFHRRGIGKALIQRYERECTHRGYRNIVLRSQIYAVPFYEACGYKKTTGIRNNFGLTIQPMKKQLVAR